MVSSRIDSTGSGRYLAASVSHGVSHAVSLPGQQAGVASVTFIRDAMTEPPPTTTFHSCRGGPPASFVGPPVVARQGTEVSDRSGGVLEERECWRAGVGGEWST
eukprot:COSAG02_NODE_9_length_59728_cov_36.104714_26_plen_104_part_00